jgi:peptidoglycan/LPS O-acetylase OafA/YrhL
MITLLAPRWAAVDWCKALAILAVIVGHAGFPFWAPQWTATDLFIRRDVVFFHVPMFILIAGFLHSTSGSTRHGGLASRFVRIVPGYFVASLVARALGHGSSHNPASFLYELATGTTFGIYYFVVVLLCCITVGTVLSAWKPLLYVVLVAVSAYATVTTITPELDYQWSWLWKVRNPLHYVGYYLLGMLLREHWAFLQKRLDRHRWSILIVSLGVISGYLVGMNAEPLATSLGVLRAAYTVGLATAVFAMCSSSPVPRGVRYLSENSYTLFLYHNFFQLAVLPYTSDMESLTRTSLLTAVGLIGGVSVCLLGEALLGKFSRPLLGTR